MVTRCTPTRASPTIETESFVRRIESFQIRVRFSGLHIPHSRHNEYGGSTTEASTKRNYGRLMFV